MKASAGLASLAGQASAGLANGPAYSTSTLTCAVKILQDELVSAHLTPAGSWPAARSSAIRRSNAGRSSSDATWTM